jgi:hypothetical protein
MREGSGEKVYDEADLVLNGDSAHSHTLTWKSGPFDGAVRSGVWFQTVRPERFFMQYEYQDAGEHVGVRSLRRVSFQSERIDHADGTMSGFSEDNGLAGRGEWEAEREASPTPSPSPSPTPSPSPSPSPTPGAGNGGGGCSTNGAGAFLSVFLLLTLPLLLLVRK